MSDFRLEDRAQESAKLIRKQAWQFILQQTRVKEMCSTRRAKEIERQLEADELPDITEENVWGLLDNLSENLDVMFSEALTEVFKWLRRGDYKTNSTLPLKQYLEEDRQLSLYALAVTKSYPNAEAVKLIWHFLSFNQDVVMQKTEEELERLRLETIETIKRIESTREFPTKTTALCNWCEFRPMCPEWAHIAKTESMTLNRFLHEPGVKLVNRYAELTEKKKSVEGEMEMVKEAP